MAWTIIDARERDLLVRGAESGSPLFTRQAELALRFDGQAAARKWIDRNVVGTFGELALMRCKSPRNEKPAGLAGLSAGEVFSHEQNTTIPESTTP